ncbi:MAG: SLC13/DASS family transporter [Ignavibacteriales bacterium]|nr:MAG: SLC13/DASS family transporter [Ignavibacteriales bacterium]
MSTSQKTGLWIGILAAVFILVFVELDYRNPALTKMAAIALLMAIWWMTEAIPLAATSLVPLILFPLTGLMKGEEIASAYINSVIFLFLGGFMLAIAMENSGLHKRIALKIITMFGASINSIILGFMFSTAFLSMWISNTATAVMMLPIAMSIIAKIEAAFGTERTRNFSKSLMLSIAYACSIGGIATLIGTPPNLAFVKILSILFPQAPEISFGTWMLLCLPVTIILLFFTYFLLTRVQFVSDKNLSISKNLINDEYQKLGKISFDEKSVGMVFLTTALLWIFRTELNLGFAKIPGWSLILPNPDFIDDGIIAVMMASSLFFIPSKSNEAGKSGILDSTVFSKVPWSIILLFGGGFALAKGFTSTGLSEFIGAQFNGMQNLSPVLIVLTTAIVINFLTELTSNTATAQMILPVVASVSVAIGLNPLMLMITAALSASMAFMLPVATPPNTVVFASGKLKIIDMVKAGVILNITSVIIISLLVYLLGSILFSLHDFPDWAIIK